MIKKRNQSAFSIIELLVAISIVAILATLTIVFINSARAQARDVRRVSDLKNLQNALELYKLDEDSYPSIITPGNPLVGPTSGTTYMNAIPTNPTPRNDGTCADQEYVYGSDASGTSYHINYCLGKAVNNISAGDKQALPNIPAADYTPPCAPNCTGKACGDDGCGGSCGTCTSPDTCVVNSCCTPNCAGQACGADDSCGGTCGTCIATPVNYWSFDTNANADIGGSAYNLTLYNAPAHQSAMKNGSYHLVRSSTQALSEQLSSKNFVYPNFSISLWVNLESYNSANLYVPVFNSMAGDGTKDHFAIYFFTVSGTKTIRIIRRQNNIQKYDDFPFDYQTGTNYNVVVTWDGWDTYAKLYINGSEITSTSQTSSGTVPAFTATNYHFSIGSFSTTAHNWDGWVDEVTFYNFTMTPAQVTAQYAKFQ